MKIVNENHNCPKDGKSYLKAYQHTMNQYSFSLNLEIVG